MHFGYPGENTHLEQHGVSEESFWPSFTDIMMVIVMVFLLVTVSVILNNWTLISELKNSIQAQQVASSLAENTKEQNTTLEDKLASLEQQIVTLNAKLQTEKTSHLSSQQALATTRRTLLEKETSLSVLETTISKEKAIVDSTKKELEQKSQTLTSLQTKLTSSDKLNAEQVKANQALQDKLEDVVTDRDVYEQQLANQTKKLALLTNFKEKQSKTQVALTQLQAVYNKLQTSLANEKLNIQNKQTAYDELKSKQQTLEAKLQSSSQILDDLEQEKQSLVTTLNQKLTQKEQELITKNEELVSKSQQLVSKDQELVTLKGKKSNEELQLRSLQGEYDSLDAKYQKLLLPARSSKGKYVVSVSYRKSGRRRVIRFKSQSDRAYSAVTEKELHARLRRLKNKHKTDLYLKVVIPEKSGLSYSEAWKFTSGLQKKYDYYFQKKK